MINCPHLIKRSGVCNDPALIEEPVTWCSSRADCQTKADARVRHIASLNSIAARGDRHAYREYVAIVAGSEGTQSAEILKRVFIATRSTTCPTT